MGKPMLMLQYISQEFRQKRFLWKLYLLVHKLRILITFDFMLRLNILYCLQIQSIFNINLFKP